MLDISVENYANVRVYAIKIVNTELFWVKMNDVQKELGIKNIFYLVRKEIHGIFTTRNPTKSKLENMKEMEKN